jgi:hypothetical protein
VTFPASVVVALVLLANAGAAAEPSPAAGGRAGSGASAELAAREQALLRQYRDLEASFLRLADLLDATDPRRAELLRDACAKAREDQVADRIESIVRLLEAGQLLKAGASQQDSLARLRALLELLAGGTGPRQQASDKELVRRYLARLARSITRQRDIQGGTEAGGAAADLAARQATLADETRALADDLGGFAARSGAAGDAPATGGEAGGRDPAAPAGDQPAGDQPAGDQPAGEPPGEPGDERRVETGEPPAAAAEPGADDGNGDDEASRAGRSRQRLAAAEERMRRARERLAEESADGTDREAARRTQDEALEQLEAARAELEEILRQLREEEVDRLLVQLDARLREMRDAEIRIRDDLGKLAAGEARPERQRQLEAARLGRDQEGVATAAAKALRLVREDGSAVAIPQALDQVRDDATDAASRLARGDVSTTTRGLVDDIVAGLEEMLGALEKARAERPPNAGGGAGGRPADPARQPLVDQLAELKMIRSLQLRVNGRTRRFAQLLGEGVERAAEPELRAALERLAERQRLVERAALDIVAGRPE